MKNPCVVKWGARNVLHGEGGWRYELEALPDNVGAVVVVVRFRARHARLVARLVVPADDARFVSGVVRLRP